MSDTIKTDVETDPSDPADNLAPSSVMGVGGVSLCVACNDRPVRYKSQKLCHPCYLLPPSRRGKPHKKVHRKMSPTCTYDAAHTRCKNLWGSASNYPCIKCGDRAREWSYDGTDPTQMRGFSGSPLNVARQARRGGMEMTYSAWPEFYAPMCRSCHAEFDHPGEIGVNPNW